jgi:hypothetical protein
MILIRFHCGLHHCASINLLTKIEGVVILSGRGKWDKMLLEPSVKLNPGHDIYGIECEEQRLTERR